MTVTSSDNLFETAASAATTPATSVGTVVPNAATPPHTGREGSNPSAAKAAENAPTWFYDENVPGKGTKPDYLIDSKYKSLAEQAKGYNELRKKLGGFTGAPEKYDLDISKLGDAYKEVKFNEKDQVLNEFVTLAKTANMSQEQFTQMLKYKTDLDISRKQSEDKLLSDYTQEQIKRLGDNIGERAKSLQTWWQQNFPEYPLEKMQEQAVNADFIELLETIKGKFKYNPVPVGVASTPTRVVTKSEAAAMINDKKYYSDPHYKKEVDDIYTNLYGKK